MGIFITARQVIAADRPTLIGTPTKVIATSVHFRFTPLGKFFISE
jgi:hypothetical protein